MQIFLGIKGKVEGNINTQYQCSQGGQLNDQAISDIVNDAQTNLKIMKDVQATQKRG